MLMPKESRNLKVRAKRLLWFLSFVFIFDVFICFLFFKFTNMHPVLNGFIIICITGLLYLLFLGICAKIDKRKKEKLEKSGKIDPFTKQ